MQMAAVFLVYNEAVMVMFVARVHSTQSYWFGVRCMRHCHRLNIINAAGGREGGVCYFDRI